METVFEVKNLKSVLDPDENILIDVPKNCPLLRGDIKFRLTRNEQGLFCKEKTMAVFWNGFRFEYFNHYYYLPRCLRFTTVSVIRYH